ncbi:MAG: hypothetical protein HY689_02710 [Chloroflexi bacterium]|nr:hypothetical protein [Chloroflexota bacterium]
MPSLIMVVVLDPARVPDLLEAWQQAGAREPAILESLQVRVKDGVDGGREDFPLFPSIREIVQRSERPSKVVLVVAEHDAQVEILLAAARNILGGLDSRHTGFALVLPLVRTEGLHPPIP